MKNIFAVLFVICCIAVASAQQVTPVNTFSIGTTTITGGSTNGLLYNNSGAAGNLTTANNGVLGTNGSGVPSISSTLPSGLTIPAPITTGQIQSASGTNSAPTYGFTSDVNSGMWLTASGQLSFGTASVERLRINGNGLSYQNSAGGFQLTAAGASSTLPTLVPSRADTTTGIGAQATGNMSFIVGGTEQVRAVSTGLNIVATTDASASSGSGALQVPGGASVSKRFWLPAITTSAGLQTAVLCQSSGGEVIADSVACLASAARFKTIHGPVPDGALAKLMMLPIDTWSYKPEGIFHEGDWTRQRIGPIADDVAAMDPRLVGYDSDGRVRTYSTEQLLGFTIKAVQELNDKLIARIKVLEARAR